MASMLALTGAAYAQEPTNAPAAPAADCAPAPTCAAAIIPTPSPSGRLAYDPGFFAQFNPQNALDMVNQTPGFSLDGGDDRRGFSGAVGNLLIDGLRPSTKSQSLEDILSRIPATQVVRIELLRGADVAGDASGAAVLVNVVRVPSAGSGLWRIGGEYNRDIFGPQGEVSYSGRNGQFEYGVGVNYYSQFRMQPGRRNVYDAAGDIIEIADTPSPRDFREAHLTGNLAFPLFDGRLSANAQLSDTRFHSLNVFNFVDGAQAPLRDDIGNFTDYNEGYEVGVNWDREVGPWSIGLIGLVNRNRYSSFETFASLAPNGALNFRITQDLVSDTGETILRGTVARGFGDHRFEVGLEGAFNSLDQTLAFTRDTGGGPAALFLPNANVLVEEERADAFAVHTWRPNDQWSVETRLAGEQSTLTFTGDSNQTVDLAFFKPSVQVSRNFEGGNQLRFRAYRDVDQLDFGDFVSAAGISDNLINGGNTDLRPETSWRAEVAADLRLPANIAFNVSVTRLWIQDVADVLKLESDNGTPLDPSDDFFFDAPGNIGDGDAWDIQTQLTLPMPWLLPGARLTLSTSHWFTEVTDPVTGQPRHFSGDNDIFYEGEFRQDINSWKLAWGFFFNKGSENQTWRYNEIDTYEEGPWVDAFIETTAIEGIRIRLTAANVLDGDIRRQRNFFGDGLAGTPDDRTMPFLRLDERQREFDYDPWFIIRVSGSF
jgi:hypothetical protein